MARNLAAISDSVTIFTPDVPFHLVNLHPTVERRLARQSLGIRHNYRLARRRPNSAEIPESRATSSRAERFTTLATNRTCRVVRH